MLPLWNHLTGERDFDILHKSATANEKRQCPANACLGSTFGTGGPRNEVSLDIRLPNEVKLQAQEFFNQYFQTQNKLASQEHKARIASVFEEIDKYGGVYDLTEDELTYGVKLAWRNSPRCVGRIQWNNIKVFDERKVSSTKEMFDAICRHIVYTTNGGNIRSTITIFPMRRPGKSDVRIWNHFIIGYAGYRNIDGSILGHSINVELTEICLKLGWISKRTKQDILPLVLSIDGNDPEFYEIPPEIILEVQLTHPEYKWFEELDIRWFTLPLLSSMMFDCGGIQFPAAPFNGWFTAPEIASRDLGDVNKYNYLKQVAERMGLNTQISTSLWKDKAVVELNVAVLHSFQKAGVTIIDHHTAAEQFMQFMENEKRDRGGTPADWVWIVPPLSSSTVPTFHQQMALYFLKPSYEYQQSAWKVHNWRNPALNPFGINCRGNKLSFRAAGYAVSFVSGLFEKRRKLRPKVTIIYATETGKSEIFSRQIGKIFQANFNVKILQMNDFDSKTLYEKCFIIAITSTFGNGDPPTNGEGFYQKLSTMKKLAKENNELPLANVVFSVFALGSSAYPNVCAFGRNLDYSLGLLGGTRLLDVPCGNELSGQDETFRKWSFEIYMTACKHFAITNYNLGSDGMLQNKNESDGFDVNEKTVKFQLSIDESGELEAYYNLHRKNPVMYSLTHSEHLHVPKDKYVKEFKMYLHCLYITRICSLPNSATTIKIVLKSPSAEEPLKYSVGDHIGIFPENRSETVDLLIRKLYNKPKNNIPVKILVKENAKSSWTIHDKLPKTNLRNLLTKYLDITTPPNSQILKYLTSVTKDEQDSIELMKLVDNEENYEKWKNYYLPSLGMALEQFPSCKPDAAIICTLLPPLQPRYYSVSSSPLLNADEIHLTVGVVSYQTENGTGPTNYGVASNFLCNAMPGTEIPCFVRNTASSTFRLPKEQSRPLIMIGPGTGIAPFIGFIEERNYLSNNYGPMTLFFGCRNHNMILYKDFLMEMKERGILSVLHLAFSREPELPKTYVQDLIKLHSKDFLQQIIHENGIIYVCGDVGMAQDVYNTIQEIVQIEMNYNDQEAQDFMRGLKETDRYHMDIFGQTHRKRL